MKKILYTYYYKYDYLRDSYIIYLDEECTTIVGVYKTLVEQDSFFNNLEDINLIFKGEV